MPFKKVDIYKCDHCGHIIYIKEDEEYLIPDECPECKTSSDNGDNNVEKFGCKEKKCPFYEGNDGHRQSNCAKSPFYIEDLAYCPLDNQDKK